MKGKNNICLFIFNLIIISLVACSDDHTGVLGKKVTDFVSRRVYNAKIEITDSIYVKIKLKAPIIDEYEFSQIPYTVFPKGIDMDFYEVGKIEPGNLKADYAKIIEKKGVYEAKKNVVIINSDKDTLKTNHVFWDKRKRMIFSDDTVRIYRADGVTSNISVNGIEASENFKNIKLKKNSGTLPYSNELKK